MYKLIIIMYYQKGLTSRYRLRKSLRMPFVIRYPRSIPAGSTDDHIVINTDFAPTFLDYAGLPVPEDMQGASLRTILSGSDPRVWRSSMYYRYYRSHFNTPSHWGVRTARYKYIHYYASGESELFDLNADPGEMINRWADPACGDAREMLEAETVRLRSELGDEEDGFHGDIRAQALLDRSAHPMHGSE